MAQINYSSMRSTNEAIGRGEPKGKTAEQSGVSVGANGRASGGTSRGRRCAAKRAKGREEEQPKSSGQEGRSGRNQGAPVSGKMPKQGD